jgi:hypothetical protein
MELCKWTVDLSVLPSYQENASLPHANGFYTGRSERTSGVGSLTNLAVSCVCIPEFELGMELDSAEVRGVLIHAGQDWGRVVFDFRS